jgi:hypothetical protein
MSSLLQQLSLLAREANERGEIARAHGVDPDAARWFQIEELADTLADLLFVEEEVA